MLVYRNNEQIVIEIKKIMLEKKMTQRQVAAVLKITPQSLTKLLSKKNFGFNDAKKILNVLGYGLVIEFSRNDNGEEI